jgi:hypothetical protein
VTAPLTLDQREQILERKVHEYTAKGYVIKSLTQTDAVLVAPNRGKKAAADGCLTLIWLGLWIVPAIIGAVSGDYEKVKIHVDTNGKVTVS